VVKLQLKKSDRREIPRKLEMKVIEGVLGAERERRDGFTCFNEGHASMRMLEGRLNFVNSVK
jgi:hypothetical protein